AAHDGSVHLFDIPTHQSIPGPAGHKGLVNKLIFNPQGTLLASAAYDYSVHLFDIPTKHGISIPGPKDTSKTPILNSQVTQCAVAAGNTIQVLSLQSPFTLEQLLFILGLYKVPYMGNSKQKAHYLQQLHTSGLLKTFDSVLGKVINQELKHYAASSASAATTTSSSSSTSRNSRRRTRATAFGEDEATARDDHKKARKEDDSKL
ncbi:MAG TPA: WD40 repeat domain-containing protein, partial [Candidatus Limnocylindria bacterium]|nr:WD40 repeat domain-containing protein [Candidatus Limnocylindria bacterium]